MIAGVKRPLELPLPPSDPAPQDDDVAVAAAEAAAHAEAAEKAAAAAGSPSAAAGSAASASAALHGQEEAALKGEAAWLKQQNSALQGQLAALQAQHAQLIAAAQAQAAQAQAAAAQAQAAAPAAPPAVHNQAWTEQVNPENGQTYYWNSKTSESTYVRPHDFNPGAANSSASANTALPQTKGPPGANLFVVRKMRRGEYDEFNDQDLQHEFGKYGVRARPPLGAPSPPSLRARPPLCAPLPECLTPSCRSGRRGDSDWQVVTRAEMTIDKENGWSKGFGFVSYATVEEADAAIAAVHGSWVAGREMKVEKTHDSK